MEIKSLLKYYREAIKNVPLLKYSKLIIVTTIILALIAYFKLKNEQVFLYAFLVLFLTFLTFVCAQLAQSKDKIMRFAFYIVTYCVVITMSITILSFASFLLFEKPAFYERWLPLKKVSSDSSKIFN